MYIQGHHLDYHKSEYADQNGYDTKASFRVNGGSMGAISNANLRLPLPGVPVRVHRWTVQYPSPTC